MSRRSSWVRRARGFVAVCLLVLVVTSVATAAVLGGRTLIRYLSEPPPDVPAGDESEVFKGERRAAFHVVERVAVGLGVGFGVVLLAVLAAVWLGRTPIVLSRKTEPDRPRTRTKEGSKEGGERSSGDGSDHRHRRYVLDDDGDFLEEFSASE